MEMTDEENGIMRDIYYFLRDHINPPARGTENCTAFWNQTVKDLSEVARTWNNHPLATCLLMAIYDYLDWKSKTNANDGDGPFRSEQEA